MVWIIINVPSKDHRLDVHSTDVVDPIIEKYSENLDDPAESCYYEPAFIIGKGVPLHRGKTFAECGIEHGDTLYQVLGKTKYIIIVNEIRERNVKVVVPIPLCGTVGDLIEMMRGNSGNCLKDVNAKELALRKGDEVLDKSKTLAEYNTKNNDVMHLFTKYKIPIGVPTYTKMKQILFKPGDTIADVKKEAKMKMPDFKYTAQLRKPYSVPLKGIVKTPAGNTMYIYLELFCETMKMFMDEYCREVKFRRFTCLIKHESTLDDFHRIVSMDFREGERIGTNHHKNWPKEYAFNCAWMRTFVRTEAMPLSPGTPMPLYFFPLCTKIFRTDKICPSTTAEKFVHLFCEETLDLKGLKRLIYHPQSGEYFYKNLNKHFHKFCSAIESYSVILAKPRTGISCRFKTATSTDVITVQVHWQGRSPLLAIQFNMTSTDTINTLKDVIEQIIQVPFYMQMLMFNGKPIDGNCTFKEMGITDNSTLDLLPSPDFQ